ncbi:MAG: CheR family methyltransferase, partial [Nitrospirota bacterium]
MYIIPPNKDIIINKGILLLMEPKITRGIRHPIDVFFRSLAEDQKEKAICIVLSGTGTEGTLGLQAVKAEGGFVIVQSPETATYEGMPGSAISTGMADLILPPEKMPDELLNYARQSLRVAKIRPKEVPGLPPDYLKKIFVLIREHTGNDFSDYKQSTINRRIEKRMFIHGIEKTHDYVLFLQQNRDEIRSLFKELLISVTKFFRDPEAFEALKKEIIPELLGNRLPDQPVRVWVVGCTTGEEAYSIAMLFKEYRDENLKHFDVQIFATDIDNDAIEKARAGVFPESIAVDVSPERLRRFFVKEKNNFRIKKEVREMIVFSVQNVIKDPPFSKLDLISCRNLLIYMNQKLQKKVLPVFHYGLNRDGFLFLGNSETVGEFADLFSVVDRQWKIYRRKGEFGMMQRGLDMALPAIEYAYAKGMKGETKGLEELVPKLLQKMLLDLYAPACVIVNDKLEIRYFHGRTGKYLEPAPGEARFNLIDMAREGLKPQLYRAAFEAQKQRRDVTVKNFHVKINGEIQNINLVVKPVRDVESLKGWLIVIFDEIPMPAGQARRRVSYKGKDAAKRIGELEQELKNSKESLQITIEELETSNEELKSTNEELQSSNEELQSTNEELETSREELQSLNEELGTVNSELQ